MIPNQEVRRRGWGWWGDGTADGEGRESDEGVGKFGNVETMKKRIQSYDRSLERNMHDMQKTVKR